jgi:hypothetical protein
MKKLGAGFMAAMPKADNANPKKAARKPAKA